MKETILVVEDESGIAENISYALETEGYTVIWKTTATEATEALTSAEINLMILDVGLPDGNGFDVCRTLRQHSGIPVIFLTARASEIDRVVGLELGADDYVVKPFSPRELCARVRAVLRRTETGTRSPSKNEKDFHIDTEGMRITYFGTGLDLSRYEYRLLEYLMTHPGRVFTRDQLMERVWEEPGSSLDRTVDTHIKTLRSKLRQIHPETDPIKTHRGIGYSWKDAE